MLHHLPLEPVRRGRKVWYQGKDNPVSSFQNFALVRRSNYNVK